MRKKTIYSRQKEQLGSSHQACDQWLKLPKDKKHKIIVLGAF